MCVPGEHQQEVDKILAELGKQLDDKADVPTKPADLEEMALLELGHKLRIPCAESCLRDQAFDWAVKRLRRHRNPAAA